VHATAAPNVFHVLKGNTGTAANQCGSLSVFHAEHRAKSQPDGKAAVYSGRLQRAVIA
jgi:hypothetical protein